MYLYIFTCIYTCVCVYCVLTSINRFFKKFFWTTFTDLILAFGGQQARNTKSILMQTYKFRFYFFKYIGIILIIAFSVYIW